MNIALHGRRFRAESIPFIQQVFKQLQHKKAKLWISESFLKIIKESFIDVGEVNIFHNKKEMAAAELVISLGGDGTLLETITFIGDLQIPVLGINTGRLGFLATTPKNQVIQAIDAIFSRSYTYDKRTLLRLENDRQLFGDANFALNEFTILKTDTSSMITVHTYIDGEYLNSYWADGLIVSTPTGSTGYSLSCGGPIVLPHSNNFVITPVSAHNLNVRPMVVSDESIISFEVEGRSNKFLISLDSRSCQADTHTQLAVKKEKFIAKLVKFNEYNFLDTLRNKLNWGLDLRN